MEPELAKLCALIIAQRFGPSVEAMARLLLARGRLSLPECLGLARETRRGAGGGVAGGKEARRGTAVLDQARVYECLFVLIQAGLVWHTYQGRAGGREEPGSGAGKRDEPYSLEDEFDAGTSVYFELNIDAILDHLAWPRLLRQVDGLAEGLAEPVREARQRVISHLLVYGKAQIKSIVTMLSRDREDSQTIERALESLAQDRSLCLALPSDMLSPTDLRLRLEQEALDALGEVAPSAKKIAMTVEAAHAKLAEMMEEAFEAALITTSRDEVQVRRRRPVTPRKRRIEDDEEAETEEEEFALDRAAWVTVNTEHLNIVFRNQLAVQLTKDLFRGKASAVVKAMCQATVMDQRSITEKSTPSVTVRQILGHLADREERRQANGDAHRDLVDSSTSQSPGDTKEVTAQLEAMLGHQSDDEDDHSNRISAFRAATACGLVSRAGSAQVVTPNGDSVNGHSPAQNQLWQVDLDHVGVRLKKRVLDQMISTLYGQAALRIVNLLLDKNKLDEKAITNYAMFPSKDVRIIISLLARDHIISLQEVPKSNDRAPARTLFFWYIELATSFAKITIIFYKMLANCLVKLQALRETNAALLLKLERTDVKEMGDRLLTTTEVQAKKDYYKAKSMLDIEVQRLERLLFIMIRLPG